MPEFQATVISKKTVRKNFNTIGLFLIIYILLVLLFPYALNYYFVDSNSSILEDEFLFFGIYFLIIVFGTVIPFFLMRKFCKVRFKHFNHNVSSSILQLLSQAIVFFTCTIASTFIANIIATSFNLEEKLIASIGFSYDEAYLNNYLYVFMLIVVTPIIEEYAFRGVLLHGLGKYGRRFGVLASSIIFALAHVNFAEMLPAFIMGYLLSKTALKYRSIKPTILIHIVFNAIIYGLCIAPQSVTKYVGYGLIAICIFTIYLIMSGKHQRIIVTKGKSYNIVSKLFYTSPSIVTSIVFMIVDTLLFIFIR